MSGRGNHRSGSAPLASRPAGDDQRTLRRLAADFAHRPLAMIGLVILVVVALDTLFAPLLVGTRAVTINVSEVFLGWSGAHPLGTDELGRDELARLLVGIHSSVLFAGMALLLAVVLGLIVFAAVRLVGRTRGQEWGRWAELAVVPVIGVILLGLASWVVSRQVPANFPSQFSVTLSYLGYAVRHPFPFVLSTDVSWVLVDLLIIGELARFGYLLVQRLRRMQAPPASGGMAPSVPAWLSIVGSALVVGLWIAGDALLIEPSFAFSGVGLPLPPIPSLGGMLIEAEVSLAQPTSLIFIPLTAVLVMYATCNLAGFGLRDVLQRTATT